jgi:hypothetical protein
MLAHSRGFSPPLAAKSAQKVSPFCHMEQQINTKASGEPSQIRRDPKIFWAISRPGFGFVKLYFLYILQRLN